MSGIVAIVGSAKTTRDKAPWDDPLVQIWGANEAMAFPWMRRADAMFQMHARWSFTRPNNRNDPHHWAWLQDEHPFPIYMQQAWPDIPSSVAYPLEQVVERFGRRYFTSTISYMIALAMLFESSGLSSMASKWRPIPNMPGSGTVSLIGLGEQKVWGSKFISLLNAISSRAVCMATKEVE